MAECIICGKADAMGRKCNECNLPVCTEHRLPEKHNCPALLESDDDDGQWFDDKFENVDEEKLSSGDSVSTDYDTVDPDTTYRRRDIEPEYEHESPGLNPDGSLDRGDDQTMTDDDNEPEETSFVSFGRLIFVLLLIAAGVIVFFAMV